MTSITWAGPRCVQELATFLGPQNRTQGRCEQHPLFVCDDLRLSRLGSWTQAWSRPTLSCSTVSRFMLSWPTGFTWPPGHRDTRSALATHLIVIAGLVLPITYSVSTTDTAQLLYRPRLKISRVSIRSTNLQQWMSNLDVHIVHGLPQHSALGSLKGRVKTDHNIH